MSRNSFICKANKTVTVEDGKITKGCTRHGCIIYPCEQLKELAINEDDIHAEAETQKETINVQKPEEEGM